MKRNLFVILLMTLFAAGLAGCEQEGPAERAGEQIDEAMQEAGEKMDDAVEEAGDKVEEAGDAVENAASD
jgi:predicted small secreted protein